MEEHRWRDGCMFASFLLGKRNQSHLMYIFSCRYRHTLLLLSSGCFVVLCIDCTSTTRYLGTNQTIMFQTRKLWLRSPSHGTAIKERRRCFRLSFWVFHFVMVLSHVFGGSEPKLVVEENAVGNERISSDDSLCVYTHTVRRIEGIIMSPNSVHNIWTVFEIKGALIYSLPYYVVKKLKRHTCFQHGFLSLDGVCADYVGKHSCFLS